jgi:hypothetical protein
MIELMNVAPDGERFHPGIDRKNYATHKRVVDQVVHEILREQPEIMSRRSELNRDWVRYWDISHGRHNDYSRVYEGQSDLYMPRASDAMETLVEQTGENLFPRSELMDIVINDPDLQQYEEHFYELILHDIEQAQVELQIHPLIRQGLVCGVSPVKTEWKTVEMEQFVPRPSLPQSVATVVGEQIALPEPERIFLHDGPTFNVVDLARWYIWPSTVQNVWEAWQVFETVDKTFRELKSMEAQGKLYKVDRVKDMGLPKEGTISSDRDERLEHSGLTIETEKKRKAGIYELKQTWCNLRLPNRKGEVPCEVLSYGNEVLLVRQNPFWDQLPPYLVWRPKAEHDNFYGRSRMALLEHPQYMFNATLNLAVDNVLQINSPMLAVWEAQLGMEIGDIKYSPAAAFPTSGPPQEVMHWHRPPDVVNSTFFMSSSIGTAIEDFMGAPPILQGNLGNKEKTAAEARILEGGASSGVRALTRSLELMVMNPLLRRFLMRTQQFRSVNRQEQITKLAGIEIPIEALTADVNMRWHSSTQAVQRAQEAQISQELALSGSEELPPEQAVLAEQAGAAGPAGPNGAGLSGLGLDLGI